MTKTPEQIALAVQALAHIEAHPDDWDQTTWRCETGMCFAGWTATLAGREWLYEPGHGDADMMVALPGEEYFQVYGAPAIDVGDVARGLLGLDRDEAQKLFNADNDLEDLRRMVSNLVEYGSVWDDGIPQVPSW